MVPSHCLKQFPISGRGLHQKAPSQVSRPRLGNQIHLQFYQSRFLAKMLTVRQSLHQNRKPMRCNNPNFLGIPEDT